MLISYVLILSIAVVAVYLLMYLHMTRIYKEQLLYSASQSFEQVQEFLNYRIHSVIYVSNVLRVNESVQGILTKEQSQVEGDIIQQREDMMTLENYIYSICNSVDIYQISLYLPDYLMYSNQEVLFRNLDAFRESREYALLMEGKESGIWLPPQELYSADTYKSVEVISYLQTIRDLNRLENPVAVARISVRSADIHEMIEKSNITISGSVWIENEEGELFACSNEELYQDIQQGFHAYLQAEKLPGEWSLVKIGNGAYYIRGVQIPQTDWRLVAVMPREEIFQNRDSLLTALFLVTLALIGVVILASAFVSHTITSRITRLAAKMESVKEGIPHLEEEEQKGYDDEIGQLYQSFQSMSNRLEELMNREYENGKTVKHAELRALQAQINPHFLYNTLDLINWEALDCGADRITKISRALAKFYKLSLNKGKEFSHIREELAHVRYYIMIQNFRYDDRLQLTEEVPEELLDYEVLHIVLQPLVENSFVHGMAGKAETEVLSICIKGYDEGEDLILEVSDNGCGMSEEQKSTILDEEKGSGYGVRNIHERFRLVYGEQYGLQYMDNPWGGVTVRLKFPKEGGKLL
ncbi:MAG: sensor histidine kinase [Lachnospiraceae bacterium]|nr:sensor histidine kinase [Lachnospiraceae bacterium]